MVARQQTLMIIIIIIMSFIFIALFKNPRSLYKVIQAIGKQYTKQSEGAIIQTSVDNKELQLINNNRSLNHMMKVDERGNRGRRVI